MYYSTVLLYVSRSLMEKYGAFNHVVSFEVDYFTRCKNCNEVSYRVSRQRPLDFIPEDQLRNLIYNFYFVFSSELACYEVRTTEPD